MSKNDPAERAVRDIRRKTRKQYSAEEKIRIVVSGLRGEDSIAELCRRVGRNEARVAVGKAHDEKMRPQQNTGDDRIRLAEVCLSVTRRVHQRHEHLPETITPFPHVILDDGLFTRKAMFIAKTLEYPLRRMALLAVDRTVLFQNTIDDIRERVQLRALRWLAAAIARRLRMSEHLLHRLASNAKPTGRFSLAQPINMAGQPNT